MKKWFSKKIGRYLVYALLGILLITLFIISDAYNRKQQFVFLTFPKNYSITSQSTSNINLMLYAREKRTMYFDSSCISRTTLVDNITKDFYQLQDVEITRNEEIINHQDQRYYGYDFKAVFPFKVEELLLIEDAYLEFTYHNGEVLTMRVGSFAFDEIKINEEVRVTYLKGIPATIGNYVSLGSIIIEITNDSDQVINLNNLQFISPFIKPNYDYVMEIPKDIARGEIHLEDVLSDYDFKKTSFKSHFDIIVEAGSTKHLLIPLVYLKNTFINQVAFKLNYYVNDGVSTITSPSFCYFKTKREITPPEQLIYVRN